MAKFSKNNGSDGKIPPMGVSNFHVQILEAVNQAVIATDLEGTVVYLNRFAEALYGWRAAEARGQNILNLTTPNVSRELAAEIMSELQRGKIWEGEFIVQRKDGTRFLTHVADAPIYDDQNRLIGIVGFSSDVSQARRTQERLRESEEHFRAMFAQANVGIVLKTIDGRLMMPNPVFCRIIGYNAEELALLTVREITHPDDYEREAEMIRRLLAGELDGFSIEKRYVRSDGSVVWANMKGTIIHEAAGDPIYMMAIVEDVTELKKLEKDARDKEMLQKLVGALEEDRKRIAYDLNEELGQQLSALRLKLDLIRNSLQDDELRERLDELESAAAGIDEGVEFLSWELRPSTLDDLGPVAALDRYIRQWSAHSGIAAEFNASELRKARFSPEVEINLYRIVQEALGNVKKHSKATRALVGMEKRGDSIVLSVADDGKGFFPHEPGDFDNGAGLKGIKQRTLLIDGEFEIKSASGNGTVINIRFPLSAMTDIVDESE